MIEDSKESVQFLPSFGRAHTAKNLRTSDFKAAQPIQIPIDDTFKDRDSAINHGEYKAHKWNLKKDTNETGFATGMDDLSRIILDAHSDVKFNKKLTTQAGAQYWASKKNKSLPENKHWKVYVTDINADGRPEVVICDSKGDIRYVNGWHLSKTKTPLNTAHQEYIDKIAAPWEIAQKRRLGEIAPGALTLKNWIYEGTELNPDNPYGPLKIKDPTLEKAGYRARGYNPCNIFLKFVTKDLYNGQFAALTAGLSENVQKAIKSAASMIRINAALYAKYVSNKVYDSLNKQGFSDKQMKKKYPNSNFSPFSAACIQKVNEILNDQETQGEIAAEIGSFIDSTKSDISGKVKTIAPILMKNLDHRAASNNFDLTQYLGNISN